MGQIVTNALDVLKLQRMADALFARLKPVLTAPEAREVAAALKATQQRIAGRRHALEQQLAAPEPTPLAFAAGVARLTRWLPVDAPADGKLDQSAAPDGRPALHLRAGAVTSASWRAKVRLSQGRYQFLAQVFTRGVQPLRFGHHQGAGLRIAGAAPTPPYRLTGDHAWTALALPFELAAEQEVELICELRAAGGEAWFDLTSLKLERIE